MSQFLGFWAKETKTENPGAFTELGEKSEAWNSLSILQINERLE